jgi:hypothetical protein
MGVWGILRAGLEVRGCEIRGNSAALVHPSTLKPGVTVQVALFSKPVEIIALVPMGNSVKLIGSGLRTGLTHGRHRFLFADGGNRYRFSMTPNLNKLLAYVGKGSDGKYNLFKFGSELSASEVELSEDVYILPQAEVETYLRSLEQPKVVTPQPPTTVPTAS